MWFFISQRVSWQTVYPVFPSFVKLKTKHIHVQNCRWTTSLAFNFRLLMCQQCLPFALPSCPIYKGSYFLSQTCHKFCLYSRGCYDTFLQRLIEFFISIPEFVPLSNFTWGCFLKSHFWHNLQFCNSNQIHQVRSLNC